MNEINENPKKEINTRHIRRITENLPQKFREIFEMFIEEPQRFGFNAVEKRQLLDIFIRKYSHDPTVKKEYRITDHLSVGLDQYNKVNTYVDGMRVSHCRHVFLTAPVDTPIDNMDDLLKTYADHKLQNRAGKLDPEVDLWAHASNIQAWVEHGYNPRAIDSLIARVLLPRLIMVDDGATSALLLSIKEDWNIGSDISRVALIKKGDPYLGLLIMLIKDGEIDIETVKPIMPYIEFLIERYGNEPLDTLIRLWMDKRNWMYDYSVEHLDEIKDNIVQRWNDGTADSRSILIQEHIGYGTEFNWKIIVALVIEGRLDTSSVKMHIPYIDFLVEKYGHMNEDDILREVSRWRENRLFRDRLSRHEREIYPDLNERTIAQNIRHRIPKAIISNPADHAAFYWAKPMSHNGWIKIPNDKRKLIWKTTRVFTTDYNSEAKYVYEIERSPSNRRRRAVRCIIRFADGSYGDEWIRI